MQVLQKELGGCFYGETLHTLKRTEQKPKLVCIQANSRLV